MFAAVDLGSNSFRLHIGRHDGETIRVVKSARDPIRLAAGLDSKGYLTDQAMQTALESLAKFRGILQGYALDAVRVVATNTLRIAKNAPAFLPAAEKAIGYPIEIISGEEEGRLIYMGVASALPAPAEKRLVVDIGGGSTELILGQGQEIQRVESFSIGTVKQSETFFPGGRIDAGAFETAILSARSVFEDAASSYDQQYWTHGYGSSGTIRAMSEAITRNAIGDGELSLQSLEELKTRLIRYGSTGNIDLVGVKPERIAAMVGGLAILLAIMQEIGITALKAVEAGLRMGVLWDLQLRATKRDRREHSVRDFCRRFHVDHERATKVAGTALSLYMQTKPSDDGYAKSLYWSGLLHEVGMAVSHTGYHKHGAYLVENADLPGFTTREQRVMSAMVLAHKGNLRKLGETLTDPDFAKAVLSLRLAVLFMHSRIEAGAGEVRLRMKNRIELELRRDRVDEHPTISYWLEKEREWWSDIGTDFTLRLG